MGKKKISLRRKLSAYFMVVFLLPAVVTLSLLYYWTGKEFEKNLEARWESTNRLIDNRLQKIREMLDYSAGEIRASSLFQKFLLELKTNDSDYSRFTGLANEFARKEGLDDVVFLDTDLKVISSSLNPEMYGIKPKDVEGCLATESFFKLVNNGEKIEIIFLSRFSYNLPENKKLILCVGKAVSEEFLNIASSYKNSYALLCVNETCLLAKNGEIDSAKKDSYSGNEYLERLILSDRILTGEDMTLKVFYSNMDLEFSRRRLMFLILILVLGGLLFSRVLGSLLARPLVARFDRMLKATKLAALGETNVKLEAEKGDDLDVLSSNFNRLVREVEIQQDRLLEAERMKAWRDIARKMAHEIKNPLSPIRISAGTLLKAYEKRHGEFESILKQNVDVIVEEVDRITKTVNQFARFAKMPHLTKKRGDVNAILTKAVALYESNVKIVFNLKMEEIPSFPFDPDQMSQVFHNLIKNSIEALDGAGEIEIESRQVLFYNEPWVEISVRDNGVGMSEETIEKVFDPYFTTKNGGSGLGMVISRRIILEHGGRLEVESKEGEGTLVTISVPMGQTRPYEE